MSLDTPTQAGPPSAYFPNVGDSIVVGIVDVATYQQKDYDSGAPLTWPDGNPRIGKVVTGLVVTTSGAVGGGEKNNTPVGPGDLVTFWCEGSKWYTYDAALREAGGVDRGHVMRWARVADKPPTNPRHNPAKQYEAKIRPPKPEDGDLVARCIAAFNERQRTQLDVAPVGASAPIQDDDPF